ncbi:MAG: class I tRNA ligase family protein [Candidatus Didemnitutus sp.]|nr:class I tRNA ligase family protein [Candidatus Didemnitutus sp.]
MKSFYLTTAIDYVNGSPHLGHAYEKVLSDVIARTKRMQGYDAYFLTGTDEHGQKIQQSARAKGVPTQQFVDDTAQEFVQLAQLLNLSNNDFVRTTEPRHKQVVRDCLQQLFEKGEIYKHEYQGFYSTRQEQFLQEKDRGPDGKWPEIFGEVTEITESNYFFKLRSYQQWLIDYITTHEDFVFPAHRRKSLLEFLSEPLNDLCISRPKDRLEWGIPLPFDENYVTYVWFDALLNYYSVVKDLGRWPADYNVIGKDILIPAHGIYWPIMLKALGLPPPKALLVHGWWSINGAKMSKSTGNFVDPVEFCKTWNVDSLRYFLVREMTVGQDADFSQDQFLVRYNSELANNLGNLVNRTLNMTTRFAAGVVPAAEVTEDAERELQALWPKTRDEVLALSDGFQFHTALERTMQFVTATNAYIEKRAPWKLAKDPSPAGQAQLRTTLATIAEALRLASALLWPAMPVTVDKIRTGLAQPPLTQWDGELEWGNRLAGAKLGAVDILFPKPSTEKKA